VAGRMTDLIGKPASLIPTPALVVETGALERNLRLMSGFFAGRHAKSRPHFKSHKCVTIARRQLECGNAVGITCAKLSEAEVLTAGGDLGHPHRQSDRRAGQGRAGRRAGSGMPSHLRRPAWRARARDRPGRV